MCIIYVCVLLIYQEFMLAITQLSHFSDIAIITVQTYCKQSHRRPLFNTFSRYVMCYTVNMQLVNKKIISLYRNLTSDHTKLIKRLIMQHMSSFPFASRFPWLQVNTLTGFICLLCMPSSAELVNVIITITITCQIPCCFQTIKSVH